MMNRMIWSRPDGARYDGRSIVADGRRIFNPTEEELAAAGYTAREIPPYVPTLEDVKARKLAEIDAYDTSEAVNGFVLNGRTVWLDKATRVVRSNSLNCEKAAGRTDTTLWLGTTPIHLGVDRAIELLSGVELYALECYNVTASHKAAVERLDDMDAVTRYDHTVGYPDQLVIDTCDK